MSLTKSEEEDNAVGRPQESVEDEFPIGLLSYTLPFRQISGEKPNPKEPEMKMEPNESKPVKSQMPETLKELEEPMPESTLYELQEISTPLMPQEISGYKVLGTESELEEVIIETSISIPDKRVPPSVSDTNYTEQTRTRHLKLYRAALIGDWITAAKHTEDISAVITKQRDTALHVAAAANKNSFVINLVEEMKPEDLAIRNGVGFTALHYAASSGNLEIAKVMIKKNKQLANIRRFDDDYMLPLHIAALSGRKEMVDFLYRKTDFNDLNDQDKVELLVASIFSDLYDFALKLVENYPKLALLRDSHNETALHVLARKSMTDQREQTIVERLFKSFSRTKVDHNIRMPLKSTELVEKIWRQVIVLDDQQISELLGTPWRLIFVLAEKGSVEFLSLLIREYPDIIRKVDKNGYSIFHIAVLNRHEKIFNLFHEIGPLKDLIVSYRDKEGNSILHLAGMLPNRNCLNVVSGAAFQMKKELFWFNEVSKIVRPSDAAAENHKKKTARDLFVESHRELKKEGEMWMKDAANSCMVVAALVTTVVFAAALTVPGGNKEDTGAPNFLREVSFKIFAIANSISLFFCTISILSFLSILTSTFAKEEFILHWHKNLVTGLASLSISIGAIIIVFATTSFIVLDDKTTWVPILVTGFTFIPVLWFSWQQRRVFELLILFCFPVKVKRTPYVEV